MILKYQCFIFAPTWYWKTLKLFEKCTKLDVFVSYSDHKIGVRHEADYKKIKHIRFCVYASVHYGHLYWKDMVPHVNIFRV